MTLGNTASSDRSCSLRNAIAERCYTLPLLYILSILGGVLLFVGGPEYYSPRSYQASWNLGHNLVFFLWTLAILRTFTTWAKRPLGEQLLASVVVAACLGLLIEWLQQFIGRTFSVSDVARDISGAALAIAFLSPATKNVHKHAIFALRGILFVSLFVQLYPLVEALSDEAVARAKFPILADFETPLELSRWRHRYSSVWIDRGIVRKGRASLKVSFTTKKYSGVSLLYFPSDWRGYRSLTLSIFNDSPEPLTIICRIHDREHVEQGKEYSDRFNKVFDLESGWNELSIAADDIRDAPKTRTMNLKEVSGLTVFTTDLKRPKIIYIDNVRLVK